MNGFYWEAGGYILIFLLSIGGMAFIGEKLFAPKKPQKKSMGDRS